MSRALTTIGLVATVVICALTFGVTALHAGTQPMHGTHVQPNPIIVPGGRIPDRGAAHGSTSPAALGRPSGVALLSAVSTSRPLNGPHPRARSGALPGSDLVLRG